MDGHIFISYRRDDTIGFAGRISDRLAIEFGREAIFMDIDTIKPGTDFVKAIDEEVGKSKALLALIGPKWLTAEDAGGNRRIHGATDYVRIEIASALARNIFIIPLLCDGAQPPRVEELPDDIKPLAFRNALEVGHSSFQGDARKLIDALMSQGVNAHAAHIATQAKLIFREGMGLGLMLSRHGASYRVEFTIDRYGIFRSKGTLRINGATTPHELTLRAANDYWDGYGDISFRLGPQLKNIRLRWAIVRGARLAKNFQRLIVEEEGSVIAMFE